MEDYSSDAVKFGGFAFPQAVLDYIVGTKDDAGFARTRADRYWERMQSEYAEIRPFLPTGLNAILDIGCGLGGIDVMIARNHSTKIINLLDGRGEIEKRKIGFHTDVQAWANVEMGAAFVRANFGDAIVQTWHPDEWPDGAVDLVISLRSWGHHYPVDQYVPLVQRVTRGGGRIILDVRRKTDARQKLEAAGFGFVALAGEGTKHQRMVFER